MKTIQITIDEPLLAALDRALQHHTRARSAFVRRSIQRELKRMHREELAAQEVEAYKRYPVLPGEFDVAPELLAWGDDWKPQRKKKGRR